MFWTGVIIGLGVGSILTMILVVLINVVCTDRRTKKRIATINRRNDAAAKVGRVKGISMDDLLILSGAEGFENR